MEFIYLQSQIRELESLAMSYGISGDEMMSRAGYAAFITLKHHWPSAKTILIICGSGNNGGDGYVLARLLHERDFQVQIRHAGKLSALKNEALQAYEACKKAHIPIQAIDLHETWRADVLVDAFLGIGLNGELKQEAKELIEKINASNLNVFALDVPSGLNADTGTASPLAVNANVTLTFIGKKIGLLTNDGPDYCGTLFCDDLGLPNTLFEKVKSIATACDFSDRTLSLPPRKKNSHKGNFGHVLIIGGAPGMSGAVKLAGMGALRAGAGRVTVMTHEAHAYLINMTQPELMSQVWNEKDSKHFFEKVSVLALGPGLGQSDWSEKVFEMSLHSTSPMILDADALNLLSQKPQKRNNWILTPHPGEAARLLGTSAKEIQQDRLSAIKALQKQYGGVIVLKGCGTLIADGNTIKISTLGNPSMASGGMGDLLTGMIAGFFSQHASLMMSACLGVMVHARAGDLAVKHRQNSMGLLASDLVEYIM